jgi:hypothetical protein
MKKGIFILFLYIILCVYYGVFMLYAGILVVVALILGKTKERTNKDIQLGK